MLVFFGGQDNLVMCLYLASCPCTIYEFSVVDLTALSTPCEGAGKFGNFNSVPFNRDSSSFLEKNTPLCERSNKVNQFVACNSYFITSHCHFSMILMHILLVIKCAYQVLDLKKTREDS